MPLPRVAVLCVLSGMGGAEFSLLELVRHLRGAYEFHLIVPGEGPLKERAEAAGARVWILDWPEALAGAGETAGRPGVGRLLRSAVCLPAFTRKLSKLLDEIRPEAFITNAVKAHVIGALVRKRKDVPLVWYMRDGLEERALSRKVLALLSRRCELAICISKYVASQFRRYVSSSVPAREIYNIVDLNRFRPGSAAPVDLRKDAGDVWFGVVGAITPLKGLDIFLDAAERAVQQMPHAVFVIVGNNSYVTEAGLRYEEMLRERVLNSSSLRERVKFLGFRNDVPGILSQLDVLVQPNRGPEGLGRSVLEAMACEVPVIAVNKWGPAELIEDEESGLLFAPLDTEQLAAHMLRLGRDERLRKTMGKQGHEWIQQNLVASELAGKFEGILASAIGGATADAMTSRPQEVTA